MQQVVPKFDRWMMIFTVIDILFLPYVFFVTITYSFVFVIWWFFKRKDEIIKSCNDFRLFLLMTILMLFSTLIGVLMNPGSSGYNLTLWLQLIVTYLHLYVFKYYFDRYSFNLKPYLIGFIVFVVITALAFNFNGGLYYEIRNIWSARATAGLMAAGLDSESIGRFGFIWMDENNIGYMLNSIVIFLLCNERLRLEEKIFVIACDLFVLISCMSSGGLYSFGIGMGALLFFRVFGRKVRKKRNKLSIAGFFMLIVIIVALVRFVPVFLKGDVATASMERYEENSSESRQKIYTYILENTNFIEYAIVGRGAETKVNGLPIKPHNIHFFYILAYGMISWILMLYILFRKRKQTMWIEYIWIIPFFLGATVNIIIGEEKAMCIALLLLAASISPKYLNERRG